MGGIHDWIRRKLKSKGKSKSKGEELTPDSLPFLPQHRPTALTASPSRQSSDLTPSLLLSNYGLFGRLPYELRREVLTAAFGGRTLHVGLTFGHPLVRRRPAKVAKGEQAARRHCGLGSQLVPDKKQRQAWQWFGCVCHRRTAYTTRERENREAAWGKFAPTIEPCDDACLKGRLCSCDLEHGTSNNAECFVGIMGWLLACRQAYVCRSFSELFAPSTHYLLTSAEKVYGRCRCLV
jgi:hypothetical protein